MKITNKMIIKLWLQFAFRFMAPFIIPFLIIFTKKTTKKHRGHYDYQGKDSREFPNWLSWIVTPDDILIPQGLYEPTVIGLYEKFGWFVSTWYWLGFRNVGHGILFNHASALDQKLPKPSETRSGLFGLVTYKWQVYNDFYSLKGKRYYATPKIHVGKK